MSDTEQQRPAFPKRRSFRREGREAAFHYLFAHEIHSGATPHTDEEIQAFWELHSASPKARAFADELIAGVLQHQEEIDRHLAGSVMNFEIDRLAAVDRNILRVGIYELLYTRDLDAPIIISEAVDIARLFGNTDSPKFVNGVIDRIARSVRGPILRRPQFVAEQAPANAGKPVESPHQPIDSDSN